MMGTKKQCLLIMIKYLVSNWLVLTQEKKFSSKLIKFITKLLGSRHD